MISKKDITKAAKKILRRQKGLRDHQIIHPQREWIIGLLLMCFIVGGIAVWSSTTYLSITDQSVTTNNSETGSQTVYRTEVVDAALTMFRERAENYEKLLENRIVTPVVTAPPVQEVDEEEGVGIDEEDVGDDVEISRDGSEGVEDLGTPQLGL